MRIEYTAVKRKWEMPEVQLDPWGMVDTQLVLFGDKKVKNTFQHSHQMYPTTSINSKINMIRSNITLFCRLAMMGVMVLKISRMFIVKTARTVVIKNFWLAILSTCQQIQA